MLWHPLKATGALFPPSSPLSSSHTCICVRAPCRSQEYNVLSRPRCSWDRRLGTPLVQLSLGLCVARHLRWLHCCEVLFNYHRNEKMPKWPAAVGCPPSQQLFFRACKPRGLICLPQVEHLDPITFSLVRELEAGMAWYLIRAPNESSVCYAPLLALNRLRKKQNRTLEQRWHATYLLLTGCLQALLGKRTVTR